MSSNRSKYKPVKTPTVLQMEPVDCGAAALGIIMGHHKKFEPLDKLRTACGVNRDGSKASDLVKAARQYGLKAEGFRKSVDDLLELKGPYIVFWNFNHFLVVEGFGKKNVYLNDPATGRRTVTYNEFNESFTGVVLTFEPGADWQRTGKPERFLPLLKQYLMPLRSSFLFLLLLFGLVLLLEVIAPIFSKVFIDNILIQHMDDWLPSLLSGIAVALVLIAITSILQNSLMARLRRKINLTLSYHLMQQVLRKPIPYYAKRGKTEIASRYDLCASASDLISGTLLQLVFSSISLLFFGTILFIYSPYLMGIVMLVTLVNVLVLRLFREGNQALIKRSQKSKFQLMSTSMQGLLTIETLKATARESDFFEYWAGHEAKVLNEERQWGRNRAYISAATLFLSGLSNTLILLMGGFAVMESEITMGMLVAFVAFTHQFTKNSEKVVSLSNQVLYLKDVLLGLESIFNVPNANDWSKASTYENTSLDCLPGAVTIKDLNFGYDLHADPLIENFNLHLQPGQQVALVGGSGSGKSTIAKLISGLYTPWSGSILLDGKARNEWPRHMVKHSLGMVDQELFLFEGKVREVLSFWDEEIPEAKIIQACKDAHIHDEISARPGAYESTIAEDGTNFSGGQRQRLEIARALVNEPSILILDEATSALDPVTEKAVNEAIRKRNCTCIIVAHRLSTIRDCDEIIVLEKGKVVERGTHDELVAKKGSYVELISNTN